MNTNKGFAPILILVILGLVGIMGFLAIKQTAQKEQVSQPTRIESEPAPPAPTPVTISEPPENWDIYSSLTYNFAIGVPPGWKAVMNDCSDTETPPSMCHPRFKLETKQHSDINIPLIILRIGPVEGKSLEEFANDELWVYRIGVSQWTNPDDLVLEQTTFKNKKAFIITGGVDALISIHKERYYIFEQTDLRNKRVFDQILSTFKFTD